MMKCCEERWVLKWWEKRPGKPNMTRRRQVEERIGKIGLKEEDAADTTKRRNGVCEL